MAGSYRAREVGGGPWAKARPARPNDRPNRATSLNNTIAMGGGIFFILFNILEVKQNINGDWLFPRTRPRRQA